MSRIKIIIIDDHSLILNGLSQLLEDQRQFEVAGTFQNPNYALSKLEMDHTIQIVITDINMPEMSGFELIQKARTFNPKLKFVIISMFENLKVIKKALDLNVEGYLLKNADKEVLVNAIETVIGGNRYYMDEVKEVIFSSNFKEAKEIPSLSERELAVVRLISQELTTKEIAKELFLSPNTIEIHRKNLFTKMDVKNVAGLIRRSFEIGVLE